ncbi:MAG TPA: hypothetical protein VGF67_17640 [Ktedonobacteraceae bacterium]|jgi:nucleoside phosphorylase
MHSAPALLETEGPRITITGTTIENLVIGEHGQITNNAAGHGTQSRSSPADHPASKPGEAADLLLVTATDTETDALLDVFPARQSRFAQKMTYYDFGVIAHARICLVQCEKGIATPGGSLLTIMQAIEVLSPGALLLVGLAFGTGREQQVLGDILVSQQIMLYDNQKIERDASGQIRRIARGDRVTASPWLLGRCREAAQGWGETGVRFGLLLSGEQVIDHRQCRDQLVALEPEAIGGETEGGGLYLAAQNRHLDWIIIKAICDWADGQKSFLKEQSQGLAARNTAKFVHHLIQKGGFARSQ